MGDTYIEAFTGMLGGGKTYNAVIRLLPHLAKGGHVYSNVVLYPAEINKYLLRPFGVIVDTAPQIHYLTTDEMREFPRHIARGTGDLPVMLICDEAHLLWGNLEWASVGKDILQFITLTRKFSVHVIIITQHIDNVAKQFRRLVQFFWTFRDIRKLRIPILHINLKWLPLLQVICVDSYSKEALRNELITLDKEIFPLYETRQIVVPMSLAEQQPGHVRSASWAERFPRLDRRHWGLRNIEWAAVALALVASLPF